MTEHNNRKSSGRLWLTLFALGVCAVSLALGISPAGATKVVKLSFGEAGSLGGQFQGATNVAVNASGAGAADSGDVYVVESTNNRVQRFDGDGNFIAAFGADVISNGAQGTGDLTTGSTTISSVITTSKAFEVGQTLAGAGIPSATTITAVGEGTITLSDPASATATGVSLIAPTGAGNVPSDEVQTVRLGSNTTGGTFTLTFAVPNPSPSEATTADIPFNASSAELQAAIQGLANIGPVGGEVAVAGPAGGPWTVEFKGTRFADTNVTQMTSSPTDLTVSSGAKSVTVTSVNVKEVCTVVGACKAGAAGTVEGQLAAPSSIAVNQATGDVYVFDRGNRRVQEFDATGEFIRAWGWGVDDGSDAFQVCASACQAGTAGSSGGQFANEDDGKIAVDGAGGVYVADGGNARVQKFTAAGAFVRTWGWDVIASGRPGDAGAGFEICTSTVSGDCQAGSFGAGNGQINVQNLSIAADSAGGTYVVNRSINEKNVQKFDASGNFVSKLPITDFAWNGIAVNQTNDHVFVVEINRDSDKALIEEFDSTGTSLATHLPNAFVPIALNTSATGPFAGRIYSVNSTSVDVLEEAPAPIAALDTVEKVTATTADLSGAVEPNGFATHYRFEYSANGGSSWVTATFPEPPLGDGTGAGGPDVCPEGNPPSCAVAGHLTALLPNTEYLARIVATNSFGVAAPSEPLNFTTEAEAPRLGLSPSTAGHTTASLRGSVDPRGSAVSDCRFEWGPITSSLVNSAPCEDLPGEGQGPAQVEAKVTGLGAGGYHYRLLATNQAGTTIGDERTIEVGATLPDHRAWEMVSPPDKNGGTLVLDNRRTRAATALAPGEPMAFTFPSLQSFAGASGTGRSVDYLAVRGSDGWKTHAITAPQDATPVSNQSSFLDPIYFQELSPDLSRGVTVVNPSRDPLTPDSGPVQAVQNLYLRTDLRHSGRGSYQLLTSCPLCVESETSLVTDNGYRPNFVDASPDFEHASFNSEKNLTADATGANRKAYEWDEGEVRLLGRVPATGDRCDDAAGPACVPSSSSSAGRGAGQWNRNAVSSDGTRILFRTLSPNGVPSAELGQFYLRFAGHATVRINASENSEPGVSQGVYVWGMTPDLRYIVFTTSEQLLDEDTDSCTDLYRYSVDPLGPDGLPDPTASHLTRISAPALDGCAKASGALGMSNDGQVVYFLTNEPLTAQAPPGKSQYVYRWHGGTLRYVGHLSGKGRDEDSNLGTKGEADYYTSRVTPDGSGLLFTSSSGEGLLGYDHGDCPSFGGDTLGLCRQFYLYDAEADGGRGTLACVSCNPAGPSDASAVPSILIQTMRGNAGRGDHLVSPLSDDGRFVYFDTPEALAPVDTNGARDVYRYDSVEGDLALISSGEDSSPSYFLDASPDGRDVFFATTEQLSGWDVDGAFDVYDARVGGGLPEPPLPAPSCAGDACQPPPQALNDPTPASSAFAGVGNRAERKPSKSHARRCPKGKRRVRRKGQVRCTKRHQRTHKPRKRASHNRRAGR